MRAIAYFLNWQDLLRNQFHFGALVEQGNLHLQIGMNGNRILNKEKKEVVFIVKI